MMNKPKNYRLGFDLGYTSLGWACILLDEDNHPCGVHDFGVRIFPSGRDDKSKAPTSVQRREKRGASRNRDRYLMRRQTLLNFMIEHGLQPQSKTERKQLAEREPLALRDRGVTEALTLHELGRALFHISQRRGFKSNRITERSGREDESGLKKGISELAKQLNEQQHTLGQYLYERLQNGHSTRLKAEDSAEERWTSRQMYEDEFDVILAQQKTHHPEMLTDEVIERLYEIIFSQRPLKAAKAGLCTLIDGETRARLAYPQTQTFRILQEVNNLEIIESSHRITPEMREQLRHYLSEDFSELRKDGVLSWSKIQKVIGIKGVKFNLDCLGRQGLKADTTTRTMMNEVPYWWATLTASQQRQAIDAMQLAQTDEDLASRFAELDFDTPSSVLEKLARLRLDDGYGRVSIKAIELIEPHLRQDLVYSDACAAAGINHSDGEFCEEEHQKARKGKLSFYGKTLPKQVIGGTYDPNDKANPEQYYGKINNPTVHMALNQFRLVLNELVKEYGCPPREIYLEMARETGLSAKDLGRLNAEHAKNRKDNETINAELEKLGIAKTYANRMKYKLWEDLDADPSGRCCPLSGKAISLEALFSPLVEVEHIIPFSRSFDDGRNNKMVCYKSANQLKGNQTPFEAYGQSSEWDNILARAQKMAKGAKHVRKFNLNKYWRFLPDAMERLSEDGESFLARQLNDTKYLSRMARRYAEFVTGKYPKERRVFAIKGKFTSDLRHHWGLDELIGDFKDGKFTKDRTNHHHHAIDAIVIALSDQGIIHKLAKANKNARVMESSKMYLDVPPPFSGFSTKPIKERLKTLVISHKLDHKNPNKARQNGGSIGQLHEDTNYGHIHENIYATRKALTIDNFASQKNIDEIASRDIREAVGDIFSSFADSKGKLKTGKDDKQGYAKALQALKDERNIKKVRVHLPKDNLIPIHDKTGKAYRHVVGGNNFCAEIWVSDKDKKAGKWQCEVIRNFDVNQKGFVPQWRVENPTAMKVMRLQINDMVAIDRDGERVICRVQKMAMSGQIILRHHNDSTTEKKTEISVAGSSLQKQNARKVFVSPIGKIYDPGHAKRPKWEK